MIAELSDKNYSYASTSDSLGSLEAIPHDKQHPYEYDDLTTVKTLYDAKFAVYLVFSPHHKQYYALKVFPHEGDDASSYFLREARFHKFHHQNIISIPHFVYEHIAYSDNTPVKVSYMLMEYAKYGDFFNALVKYKLPVNETLVRTYFHQLIDGLEYLHTNGAAHLDVKLENLLLGDNGVLKLADFDLSYLAEDGAVKTRGTKNFRAPELLARTCKDPYAADIYSAGIVLFLLKTRGNLPYLEEKPRKGVDMAELKDKDPASFWDKHCHLLGKQSTHFSQEFKALFHAMTSFNPNKRPTISQIKASAWYKGQTYSKKEVSEYLKEQFGF